MSSEWDGGGGTSRRGSGAPPRTGMQPFFGMYSSKAEQILSRYRPIAPKPPAPKPDQAASAASNPSATTDSAAAAAAPQSSSTSPSYRKGRKRSSDPSTLPSPRVSKRALSSKRNQPAAAATANLGSSVVPVVEVGAAAALPMNVPCKAVAVPALPSSSISSTSMSLSPSLPSSLPSPKPGPGSLLHSSSSPPDLGRGLPESGVVWKMVPRTITLPASPWCERIRVGRIVASAAADTQQQQQQHQPRFLRTSPEAPCPSSGWKSYEQQQLQQGGNSRTVISDLGSIDTGGVARGFHSNNQSPCPPARIPSTTSNEVCSNPPNEGGECEDEDERPRLVTLPLLPDTPSRRGTTFQTEEQSRALSESSTCSRSDVPVPLRLSLFSGGENLALKPSLSEAQIPSPSEQQQQQQQQQQLQRHWHHQQEQSTTTLASTTSTSTIDVGYLEQAYGASSDPVVLTAEDGSGRVLWANLAYNRVLSDRLSGKAASAGPYIDPLGLPTQLGRFTFQAAPPPPPPDCGAVLWGFLKKFMLLSGNAAAAPDRLIEHPQLQGQQQQQFQGLGYAAPGGRSMPIAVRAAAALPRVTLCLQCITEANFYSGHLVGGLESATTQLERSSLPALVTDRSNRVKWMNSAFKQLVSGGGAGLDDGSAILVSCCTASTTTTTTSGGLFHQHPMQHQSSEQQQQRQSEPSDEEKVCFMFETDKSPYSAVSLAGQMRLDFVDAAGRRSRLGNIACEMRKLDDERFGRTSWFVWKLSSRPPMTGRPLYHFFRFEKRIACLGMFLGSSSPIFFSAFGQSNDHKFQERRCFSLSSRQLLPYLHSSSTDFDIKEFLQRPTTLFWCPGWPEKRAACAVPEARREQLEYKELVLVSGSSTVSKIKRAQLYRVTEAHRKRRAQAKKKKRGRLKLTDTAPFLFLSVLL